MDAASWQEAMAKHPDQSITVEDFLVHLSNQQVQGLLNYSQKLVKDFRQDADTAVEALKKQYDKCTFHA
jgi:hypothetical protein